MSNNTLEGLREILFDELRVVRTGDSPNLDRARAVNQIAATLVDSARVEVDAMRLTKRPSSAGFLPLAPHVESEGVVHHPNGGTTTTSVLASGVTRTVHKAS